MTLRQLLHNVNLTAVYDIINKKDRTSDKPTIQQTINAYAPVVEELKGKPKARKYSMSIMVQIAEDWFDKHKYPDVCFLNPKYVAPPKGAKPWGGKNPPKGHYNCNLNKYNRIYAMGFVPWSKLIDTSIINKGNFSKEQLLAEILWELTFYGWTEKKVTARTEEIENRIQESIQEIKDGKCVELPPKKNGGLKIVIPDSVSKQIIDITNKNKKNIL